MAFKISYFHFNCTFFLKLIGSDRLKKKKFNDFIESIKESLRVFFNFDIFHVIGDRLWLNETLCGKCKEIL